MHDISKTILLHDEAIVLNRGELIFTIGIGKEIEQLNESELASRFYFEFYDNKIFPLLTDGINCYEHKELLGNPSKLNLFIMLKKVEIAKNKKLMSYEIKARIQDAENPFKTSGYMFKDIYGYRYVLKWEEAQVLIDGGHVKGIKRNTKCNYLLSENCNNDLRTLSRAIVSPENILTRDELKVFTHKLDNLRGSGCIAKYFLN